MTAPRRPFLERLSGEVARQLVALVAAAVGMFAVPIALVLVGEPTSSALFAASFAGVPVFYAIAYLAVTLLVFRGLSGDPLRRRVLASTPTTRSQRIVSAFVTGGEFGAPLLAVVVGLGLIVYLIANPAVRTQDGVAAAAWAGLASLWVLMITAFSAAYLRRWARADDVVLPGDDDPRFGDFLYVAVQVGTTFSTSDVEVTSTRTRWIVTVNSIIAFVFNTVLVSMLISIALANL